MPPASVTDRAQGASSMGQRPVFRIRWVITAPGASVSIRMSISFWMPLSRSSGGASRTPHAPSVICTGKLSGGYVRGFVSGEAQSRWPP